VNCCLLAAGLGFEGTMAAGLPEILEDERAETWLS
jgi:hypothetical protein